MAAQACFSGVRWRRGGRFLLLALIMVAAGSDSPTGRAITATAMWSANTEANIAGYILSYGTQSGTYSTSIDVGNVTSYQLTLTPGQAYFFSVKAYNTQALQSSPSAEASGGLFSDDPLVAGTTLVKAAHLTELRSRADAARIVRALGAYSWAESITAGSTHVKAQHVTELRTALSAAFAAEPSLTPPTYTDNPLGAGTTVKAVHISELRAALATLEATP